MKTERLIVLVSPEEKARISKLAKQRHTSVGTLVRTALSRLESDLDRPEGEGEAEPSAEQAAALDRLAEVALQSMERANSALDRAFDELEETKRYFDSKRTKAGAAA